MRRRKLITACLVGLLVATVGIARATQSNAGASSTWQWRAATTTHAPQQLVRAANVTLYGAAGAAGQRLLVEANGQFVQKARGNSSSGDPVTAFVVANDQATETVVGVARSDVARLILRGANGEERELTLNEYGAFAVSSLSIGTSWQLDALASEGSSLSHIVLPQVAASCGGPVGPCRLAAGSPHDSSYPASPLTTVATARAAGNLWKLQTYFNKRQNPCVQLQMGRGGQARTCFPGKTPPTSFTPAAGAAGRSGSDWARAWVFGEVSPSVRRMTLLRRCGSEMFEFPAGAQTKRWFLRVYTTAQLRRAGMPIEVSMRDAAGVEVRDIHISLRTPTNVPVPPPAGCSAKRTTSALSIARHAALQRASKAATPHRAYTISNRGHRVSPRANRAPLIPNHNFQLYLLGTSGDFAYYRIQVAPHYTCWGSGPASTIGKVGEMGCPILVGAYPLQLRNAAVEFKPSKNGRPQATNPPQFLHIGGVVADQAASVALIDTHGKVLQRVIPNDNLFSFPGPLPHAFVDVVAFDAQGHRLKQHPEWGEHQTQPANLFGPNAVKANPQTLGPVAQRGSARGVTVSASKNGVVVFDMRTIDPAAKTTLAKGSVWFSCFLLSGQNVRHIRAIGISTRYSEVVAFKSRGVTHYDGCDAGGDYGHRWHDKYGPHSTIEIAFSAQGARYLEDRATARDLSEFVRSAKTQAIRRLTGDPLLAAIRRAYGDQVAVLKSPTTTASPGQVGVWTNRDRAIFSERSHLGDRLYVQIDAGKVTENNVRGLAFVF